MIRFTSDLFGQLPIDLKKDILANSQEMELDPGTEILREGQFIKFVPYILEGLIKVVSRFEDKDFLLYYIKPNESCVMSFASGLQGEPSKIYAFTEQKTKVLAFPIDQIEKWVKEYPEFNFLFYGEYNTRYSELLDSIRQILFFKMDNRVFNYLKDRSELTGKNPLKISHREIASDLGTAREVVSRTIKKLENEGILRQDNNSVEIL